MKNNLPVRTVLAAALALCSISCSKMHARTNFLTTFSLGETIRQMNAQEVGLASGDMSGTASTGDPSSYRHQFNQELIVKTPTANGFDEEDFLAKLKEKITQEMIASGLNVDGGGGSGGSFYINYHSAGHKGGVDVIGVRTEKDKYRVWCVVRELAAHD